MTSNAKFRDHVSYYLNIFKFILDFVCLQTAYDNHTTNSYNGYEALRDSFFPKDVDIKSHFFTVDIYMVNRLLAFPPDWMRIKMPTFCTPMSS